MVVPFLDEMPYNMRKERTFICVIDLAKINEITPCESVHFKLNSTVYLVEKPYFDHTKRWVRAAGNCIAKTRFIVFY